jgi:hypothetical protein
MYDLTDTLGDWIAAFDAHEDDCPFLAWAQDHLDAPVTVIRATPAEIALIAPMRALADMRHLCDHETAKWFAALVAQHTHSRAVARWAEERARG